MLGSSIEDMESLEAKLPIRILGAIATCSRLDTNWRTELRAEDITADMAPLVRFARRCFKKDVQASSGWFVCVSCFEAMEIDFPSTW